ncbi:FIST C-terminal domain-containing protein [Phaeovibrio sulfidiphilus]|uniref:FIST C-terminal domain-containing protein n=1 Tax=Phaeovibrio sulfidiphilus TaxID=1220600 RepID=A0A8J6YLU4_9PROT|nr:FIST N-terminal domain-containing protein [Phaeovibrio sulfidiphilus]MBE1236973.1 FIST C-terminal domain-containing protein [Phaeovibrio sulfidiphilus]
MLSFFSASARSANTDRAVSDCVDTLRESGLPEGPVCLIIKATLGHPLDRIAASIRQRLPQATLLGSSCSGVTGRHGVGESMHDIALMAISGGPSEWNWASVADIRGDNAAEKGQALARSLRESVPDATAIYLLCPGIDIANDRVLEAFDREFGGDIVIFGGTSSDTMRGVASYQYTNDRIAEHSAWAIAFSDPTLTAFTRATHGFSAYGEPLVVTRAHGHRIFEFDGKPAWQEYTARLGVSPEPDTCCHTTIPIGALAEELPKAVADEYGNTHILRVITRYDGDGTVYFPVTCEAGLKLWLTTRDEALIFSEQERSLDYLGSMIGGRRPVAVFQTDCLARGRFLFNRVVKDEIMGMMHSAFTRDGEIPPWIGMYGFGEYARLDNRNTYHNYSTALMVLCR